VECEAFRELGVDGVGELNSMGFENARFIVFRKAVVLAWNLVSLKCLGKDGITRTKALITALRR